MDPFIEVIGVGPHTSLWTNWRGSVAWVQEIANVNCDIFPKTQCLQKDLEKDDESTIVVGRLWRTVCRILNATWMRRPWLLYWLIWKMNERLTWRWLEEIETLTWKDLHRLDKDQLHWGPCRGLSWMNVLNRKFSCIEKKTTIVIFATFED